MANSIAIRLGVEGGAEFRRSMDDAGRSEQQALQWIDDALDAILTALITHRARKATETSPAPIGATQLHWHGDAAQIPTREANEITALITDPVGAALRQAIRRLGERLHLLGGTDAMREAADRVADRDPSKAGHRTSIMDSAWNSVGEGDDRWWS